MKNLEGLKTAYMERHGIIEAKRTGVFLVYYTSYPLEHCTYKVTIDLQTGNEVSREEMKRYYKKGLTNQCL